MGKFRVSCFGLSIDGFGAGVGQDLQNPLGVGGVNLHKWHMATRTFQKLHGDGSVEGTTGVDDDFEAKGFENVGAWIIGRNMFGPVRGPWPNHDWKGWWGDNPPYHVPVFVLTHHARPPIEMEGGTLFYFITDGVESALKLAQEAAKGKDVRLGGGVDTIRQYLKAGLLDEMHVAVSSILFGAGENLWKDLDLVKLGYQCVEMVSSPSATHLIIRKSA